MKTSSKVALLVLTASAVAATMAHLFFPGGLPAIWAKVTGPAEAPPPEPSRSAALEMRLGNAPDGDDELHRAERALDAGEFGLATDLFLAARADGNASIRERAERELHDAVLAWALTLGVEAPSPPPADPDGEVARAVRAAEDSPGEKAWYDAAMLAAGCGVRTKLRYLTRQAVTCALPNGPVATRLKAVLPIAGNRAATLREAMVAAGFVEDPVASAAGPVKPPQAPQPAGRAFAPPAGKFRPETRARLVRAVDLERKGTEEFDQCGPDDPKRKEHLKAAIGYLRDARDIYQEAEDEDPDSRDLAEHLHRVMEMISHVNKERTLGD